METRLRVISLLIVIGFMVTSSWAASPKIYRKRLTASVPVESNSANSVGQSSTKFDTTRALIKTAKAIARSHSTSEVLTLNLTNLLILIVLKAIIFGIGLFYFGGVSFKSGHGGGGWGRSSHSRSLGDKKTDSILNQSEMLLMLTFLLGATEDNFDCLNRVACEDPKKAKEYLKVSKMLLKGAKTFKKYVSYNSKYESIVSGLEDAVRHSSSGASCRAKYTCQAVPEL